MMNTLLRIGAAIVTALLVTTGAAEARHHHKIVDRIKVTNECHIVYTDNGRQICDYTQDGVYRSTRSTTFHSDGTVVAHPYGCPWRLFCACGVSMKIWGYAKHMAAREFYRYPTATAGPGMVAVRRHHVFYIESLDGNGNAVAYDPNSGSHLTRIHTVSLQGYSIHNPYR